MAFFFLYFLSPFFSFQWSGGGCMVSPSLWAARFKKYIKDFLLLVVVAIVVLVDAVFVHVQVQ